MARDVRSVCIDSGTMLDNIMREIKTKAPPEKHPTALVYVGCAGWSLPQAAALHFPSGDSHLSRYASRLPAVEINTSFYRPHRLATYRRWAETVPAHFRFSVKIPKSITHERKLNIEPGDLQAFLDEVTGLGDRLGCLLVQLPPSLRFDQDLATHFFKMLCAQSPAPIACEPRHVSWFSNEANSLLKSWGIARVAADPAIVPEAGVPGGSLELIYYRWHGSPRMYYSKYDDVQLATLAGNLRVAQAAGRSCWCIFDNTAAGAAIENALKLDQNVGYCVSPADQDVVTPRPPGKP